MASPPWVLHHLAHPRNTGSQDDAPCKASPEDKVAMPPQLVMLLSENYHQEGPQRVIGTSPSFSHPPSFGLGSSFSSCDPGQSQTPRAAEGDPRPGPGLARGVGGEGPTPPPARWTSSLSRPRLRTTGHLLFPATSRLTTLSPEKSIMSCHSQLKVKLNGF